MSSLILGWLLIAIGLVFLLAGAAIFILRALRALLPQAERPEAWGAGLGVLEGLAKLLEALAKLVEAFGKLSPGHALMASGLLLVGGGTYVLAAQPL